MTEAEWLASTSPHRMLAYLGTGISVRKLRLFACAWARDRWPKSPDDRARDAILTAELFADGSADGSELLAAYSSVQSSLRMLGRNGGGRAHRQARAVWVTRAVLEVASAAANPDLDFDLIAVQFEFERPAGEFILAGHVRDIFGNPFRPVAFDLRWQTSDTVALARGIYDDGAFDRVPVLADALMDAGCADEAVLAHCRSDGPHVRGCWVVDLVLGKA